MSNGARRVSQPLAGVNTTGNMTVDSGSQTTECLIDVDALRQQAVNRELIVGDVIEITDREYVRRNNLRGVRAVVIAVNEHTEFYGAPNYTVRLDSMPKDDNAFVIPPGVSFRRMGHDFTVGGKGSTRPDCCYGEAAQIYGKGDWKDLTSEYWREYVYGDGSTVRIERPQALRVSKSTMFPGEDSHRVVYLSQESDRLMGAYVRPGWVLIRWEPAPGCAPFTF